MLGDRGAVELPNEIGWRPIDLIVHPKSRNLGSADVLEDTLDLAPAVLVMRIAGIDDVQQQGRLARLGQRGAERGDELVRQVADETDGIDEQAPRRRRRAASAARSDRASRTADPWRRDRRPPTR